MVRLQGSAIEVCSCISLCLLQCISYLAASNLGLDCGFKFFFHFYDLCIRFPVLKQWHEMLTKQKFVYLQYHMAVVKKTSFSGVTPCTGTSQLTGTFVLICLCWALSFYLFIFDVVIFTLFRVLSNSRNYYEFVEAVYS